MDWSLDDSRLVYGISQNDMEFLDISDKGLLQLIIGDASISLKDVISKTHELLGLEGQDLPSFTLRIPQLVNYQINKITTAAKEAIEKHDYSGKLQPLYPVKVNQSKQMVDAVLASDINYGLEAGTKSELILIMKAIVLEKHRYVLCNGVKDREYIHLMGTAIQKGYQIIVSVESVMEAKLVLEMLPINNLKIILRVKPYVDVQGYWGPSSGRHSKFGVGISELFSVLELLKNKEMDGNLVGIHAHPGSQIENFNDLAEYFSFVAETFVQIAEKGFEAMKFINLGGGLPIDYDSSFSGNRFKFPGGQNKKQVFTVRVRDIFL